MATQETIKQMFSGGVLRDVEDVTARQMVAALQNAIDALTSGDTTTAIETFQEVIDFLEGVTDDTTLIGKLNELRTLINAKYTKPAGGIPASDLASGVIPDVSGFATKTEVNTKANSADVYTKSQTDAVIEDALENVPTGDIPTKVSELTNDAGYQTQAQVAEAISQAAIEAVVGNGDFAMTYDQASDTFNIVRLVPTISVSDDSLSFDSTAKVKTITVSGHNLKADIAITAPNGWTASPNSLAQVNGVVAETQVTLTYGGADSSAATGNLVLTSGSVSKSVPLSYTQYGGPTITVEPTSLSFEAVGGQSQSKTVTVVKFNITGDVTVAVTGANADKFSASLNGSTLTVTYTPGNVNSGNHTATIRLSADGVTKTVTVGGTVLAQSLSVSPVSLDFSGSAGTATSAKQIVLTGANLLNDVTVTAPTGFSVTRNGNAVSTITKADVMANGGVTLDVVAAGTSESGSLTFASGLASASTDLSWHEAEVDPVEGGYLTKKAGLKDGVSTPIAVDANGNQIEIEFKVKTVATTNMSSPTDTDGEVTVVSKTHEEAYSAALQNGNYSNVKTLVIPEAIIHNDKYYKVIGAAAYAFAYASTSIMTSVTFGNNIKSIGAHFAQNVQKINTLDLGNSVRAIGDQAFNKVPALTNLEIPDSVTSIGNTGISALSGLRTLIVGTGLAAISYSIEQYTGITSITLKRDGVVTIVVARINEMPSSVNLYVPSSQIANYKAHSVWGPHIYDETDNPSGKLHIQAIPNE